MLHLAPVGLCFRAQISKVNSQICPCPQILRNCSVVSMSWSLVNIQFQISLRNLLFTNNLTLLYTHISSHQYLKIQEKILNCFKIFYWI